MNNILDKFSPRYRDTRDPRDNKKKSGMFFNFPRFMYFGGNPSSINGDQSGEKGPRFEARKGQDAVGPISDRGKGGRR